MTCPSGSEPKPSSPAFFTFEQVDILAAIPTFGAWLATHTLGLPVAPTQTSVFCATEPTGDLPLITDWALLAFPPAAAFFGAYERLRNQVLAWKFSDMCQCTVPGSGTCGLTWTLPHTFSNSYAGGSGAFELGNKFVPQVTSTFYGVDVWFNGIPTGAAGGFTLWDNFTNASVGGYSVAGMVSGHNRVFFPTPIALVASREYIVSYCKPIAAAYYQDTVAPPDNTIVHYSGHVYSAVCGTHTWSDPTQWSAITPIVCAGGPPGGYGTPIAPPDAAPVPTDFPAPTAGPTCASYQDVCNELAVLLREIESLQANLTIVRQTQSPDATVFGTPHADLTGHGTISVAGILGCSVTLTSVPSTWGFTLETPRRLIPKAGAIHFSDGIHNTDEGQIHYDSQLLVNAPTFTTTIVYNFRPGITGTITPLLIGAPV